MTLDLRVAIGWLLLAIGLQLLGYGFAAGGAGAQLNMIWGALIAATGAAFYAASRMGGRKR